MGAIQQAIASYPGVVTDADAAAWGTAVTSAGGTYSATTLAALSAFITAAKANGYWTNLYCFNPLCGNQLTAALIQYVNGSWAQATNHSFVSGDYAEATGLTGNGSSKYLDTGVNPSGVLTLNSTHLSVYNRSSTAASGGGHVGGSDATNRLRMYGPFTDGKAYSDEYNSGNGRTSTAAAISTPYGHIVATRTASNLHTIYRNASSVASSATSTSLGAVPSANIYVCAENNNGTPNTFTSQPIAFYSIGAGLSSTDVSNFYTDLQAFQTSLGRNV